MAATLPLPPPRADAYADVPICSVCNEVYRSPRLLPCADTFCLDCLKDVSRESGGQSFPCPMCEEITAVPAGGCDAFKLNKYINPEMLETARAGPRLTMCSEPDHQAQRLEYYCVQCDRAICLKCKLTTHENHFETLGLYEAAASCRGRLEARKGRLEEVVSILTKKAAAAHEHLKAYKKKEIEIKEEIKAEADVLVARVLKRRDALLEKCDTINALGEQQLSGKACEISRERDTLVHLIQRVHHALGGSASQAELVDAEKEMREGQGSEARLEQVVSRCSPSFSCRPGLRPDRNSCTDDDIDRRLGKLLDFGVPFDAALDVINPVFQCTQDGARAEVHSVSHVTDDMIYVSLGGVLPDYVDAKNICVNKKGHVINPESLLANRGSACIRCRFPQYLKCNHMLFSKETAHFLYAKGDALMATTQDEFGMQRVRTITVESESPLRTKSIPLFRVQCRKIVAFDASQDEQLFAFVEEKTADDQEYVERAVLLYRKGEREPFIAWNLAYYPTDVCFWRGDEQGEKLLVADMHADAVHVLAVEDDQCRYERRLASGSALLVRPTALNVDWQNRVWIGCRNGRILMCEKSGTAGGDDLPRAGGGEVGHVVVVGSPSNTTDTAENRHVRTGDNSGAVFGDDSSCVESSGLSIVNGSNGTNTGSQLSDDLASISTYSA